MEENTYFLATTALEEFWDVSQPVIFLGEWCRLFHRREFWGKINAKLLGSPLGEPERFEETCAYVSSVYESLIVVLTEHLNSMHQVSFSRRYWRILLGSWLYRYISIIYDRYLSLQSALEKYPGFSTIVLSEDCFITPNDMTDFVSLVCDDPYNLQIYSRILRELSPIEFPRKKTEVKRKVNLSAGKNLFSNQKLRRILKYILKKEFHFFKGKQEDIFLKYSYFPSEVEHRLVRESGQRLVVMDMGYTGLPLFAFNKQMRDKLINLSLNKEDKFIPFLLNLLPFDIPKVFIEGYSYINKKIRTLPRAKAIFSSIGWYFDDTFKQWAALASENGTFLIGSQHGGGYGSEVFTFGEEHELRITDRYYSWGWEKKGDSSKLIPFFAPTLTDRIQIGANNSQRGILYVTDNIPRYTYIIQLFSNHGFVNYLDRQKRFVSSLLPALNRELRVRLYEPDYGWDMSERWKVSFPQVALEKQGVSFIKSLNNCRIFVCDHLGTTFLEVLSVNKPAILFWNPKITKIRPEAESYYDCLRSAGILHDTPESAASKLNSVYDDVEKWWSEPGLQRVVEDFSRRFARRSTNAEEKWHEEFKYLLSLNEMRPRRNN